MSLGLCVYLRLRVDMCAVTYVCTYVNIASCVILLSIPNLLPNGSTLTTNQLYLFLHIMSKSISPVLSSSSSLILLPFSSHSLFFCYHYSSFFSVLLSLLHSHLAERSLGITVCVSCQHGAQKLMECKG